MCVGHIRHLFMRTTLSPHILLVFLSDGRRWTCWRGGPCLASVTVCVTTPPAEAGGFSGQLRGNPPAYVPNAVSRRKAKSPVMHDLRRRHIPVENSAALAAMLPHRQS